MTLTTNVEKSLLVAEGTYQLMVSNMDEQLSWNLKIRMRNNTSLYNRLDSSVERSNQIIAPKVTIK
jgi:hypothetical protein